LVKETWFMPPEIVEQPWWVEISLVGASSRSGQCTFFWLSVVLGTACVIYGFRDRRFFRGAVVFLAAFWYWMTIRWMDQHGAWPQ
jgi:hypothetical protein